MPLPPVHDLLPHSGAMVLLDEILAVEGDSLSAAVQLRDDSLFCMNGAVGAWVGLEYMAQAIGAYAGYHARLRGEPVRIGYLLGTRRYDTTQPQFAVGSRLQVHIRRVWQGDDGLASFDCRIEDESGLLATANLTVYQPPGDDVVHENSERPFFRRG